MKKTESPHPFLTRNALLFLEAARIGSFSLVARKYGVTQSTISQAMLKLEDELQVELFDRETRPMRMTNHGQALFDALEKSMAELHTLMDRIYKDEMIKPAIDLGLIESVASFIGIDLLGELNKTVREVNLKTALSADLLTAVKNRDLDAAVLCLEEADPSLSCDLLFEEPWVILFPKSKVISGPVTWRSLQLCGLPYLRHGPHTANGQILSRYFAERHLSFPRVFEIDSLLVMIKMVQQGYGWAVLQGYSVRAALNSKNVAFLPVPDSIPRRKIFLASQKDCSRELFSSLKHSINGIMQDAVLKEFSDVLPWLPPDFVWHGKV
jgi:DNA-binding transcriptional LysR family regulator